MRCLALFVFLLACAVHPASQATLGDLDVLDVEPARFHGTAGAPLEQTCGAWRLLPAQVTTFFQQAAPYPEAPYAQFHQVRCSIGGRSRSDGGTWRFSINAGGTGTLQAGNVLRHFGCSSHACKALLLLPADGMAPD